MSYKNAISSDDPAAITKLEEKLTGLQAQQEEMKKANAYYRKHGTIKGYQGLDDADAAATDERIKTARSWEKQPYPAYLLTNNNGNMRRIKERIAELKAKNENPPAKGWNFDGGTVEMNTDANRIQIYFDEKPDKDDEEAAF